MPDTYFLINIFTENDIDNIYYQFGPYINYEEAVKIFMDHLDYLIYFWFPEMKVYSASISEYIIQEDEFVLINNVIIETGKRNAHYSRTTNC